MPRFIRSGGLVAGAFWISCASTTALADAESGLRVACATLVAAMDEGAFVSHDELVRQACDVERTKQLVRALVLQAEDLELAPLEWDGAPYPPPTAAPSDAGATR